MKCRIEVVSSSGGVAIYCLTCHENVAWSEDFTVEEVTATAKGHHQVMARARAHSKAAI